MSYSKPFDETEYEQRVNKAKQSMQKAGFDLLICQLACVFTSSPACGWMTSVLPFQNRS